MREACVVCVWYVYRPHEVWWPHVVRAQACDACWAWLGGPCRAFLAGRASMNLRPLEERGPHAMRALGM